MHRLRVAVMVTAGAAFVYFARTIDGLEPKEEPTYTGDEQMSHRKTEARVVVSKDGPYLVIGDVPLAEQIIATDATGGSESWKQGESYQRQDNYALCRCGNSKKKPFCDGTHARIAFDGTETATREHYIEQAAVQDGPTELALMDAEHLCAFARFCDPHGQVWSQIERIDEPGVRETFLRQVGNCPAGRLVAWDKNAGGLSSRSFQFPSDWLRTRPMIAAGHFGCAVEYRWSQQTVSSTKCATA